MSESGSYFRLTFFFFALICAATGLQSGAALARSDATVAVVNNSYANIRSGPGTGYSRLGRVYRNERLPVTDIRGGWIGITYRGRDAWIFGELVTLESTGPSQAEIDRVELKVRDLNNRLDQLTKKIEQASGVVKRRYPAPPPPPEPAVTATERPRSSESLSLARVSPAWIFIPGGPRLAAGDRLRGYGLLGLSAACAAAGYYFHDQYRGYRDDYRALDASAQAEEFRTLFNKADNRRRVSDALLYAAAGTYALNVLDYFFFLPRAMAGVSVQGAEPGSGRIKLSMSTEF